AQPKNAALAAQVQTIFRGETLRGLLLNAYGFWQMGQIMFIGAVVSFVAAAALLILSLFGIAHRRYVPAEEEVFGGHAAPRTRPRRRSEPSSSLRPGLPGTRFRHPGLPCPPESSRHRASLVLHYLSLIWPLCDQDQRPSGL